MSRCRGSLAIEIFIYVCIAEEALEANDLLADAMRKYSKIVLKQSINHEPAPHLIATAANQQISDRNAFDELKEIFANNSTAANAVVVLSADVLQPKILPLTPNAKDSQPTVNNVSLASSLADDLMSDSPNVPSTSAATYDLLLASLKAER